MTGVSTLKIDQVAMDVIDDMIPASAEMTEKEFYGLQMQTENEDKKI